jgi:hypothetical protein
MASSSPARPAGGAVRDPAELEGKVTDADLRAAGMEAGNRRGERFWVMNREEQRKQT